MSLPIEIILFQVREVVANTLERDVKEIYASQKFVEDLGVDSLDALEIAANAEEKFGIVFSDEELETCFTVGDMSRLIHDKLK